MAAFAAAACSGTVDDSASGIVLTADKSQITADGEDRVNFTVTYGGADVTASAEIFCISDGSRVENASFSTNTPGSYAFTATYMGETSERANVNAVSASAGSSKYKKNYFIAEFTEAYCINCPDGSSYLLGYFCREIVGFDNACVLAFHGNSLGEDPLAIPVTAELMNEFNLLTLPSFAFEMRVAGDLMNQRGALRNAYDESPAAHCGFSIVSAYDEQSSSAKVTVKLTSDIQSSYRVALFVVEDHVASIQKTITGGEEEDFDHRHVVRSLLTSSYKGESWGQLAPGQEMSKEYTVEIGSDWDVENVTVCALAYDNTGFVNNCLSCPITGTVDYQINN